jgi:hypothetical protein
MSDFTFLKKFEFDPNNEGEFNEKLKSILDTDFTQEFREISNQIKESYSWKKSATTLNKLITDF